MRLTKTASDDVSLDSFDDMLSTNAKTNWIMDKQVCSMCYAVEDIMTTLFTPSEFDWSGENSIVESPESSITPRAAGPLTPGKVCKMWKKKRREEKQKLMELRVQEGLFSESELMSETKQSAQKIQRSFEKRFDENDYSQRYERYGSRAHFIRDRHA